MKPLVAVVAALLPVADFPVARPLLDVADLLPLPAST